MASLLSTALQQVGQYNKTDDDVIDRLNHRYTVILLVTFTAFVSTKEFVGEPISCWAPAQFSGTQVAYTNSICWLKGTYYLETDKQLIPHHTQNPEFRIAYYQFVPYVLLLMALLFYVPHMLWYNLSRYLGYDLRKIIENTRKVLQRDIGDVASQIDVTLKSNSLKYFSRHRLTILYIFIKIFYIINCFCQFYLLSQFLSFPFHKFGIQWLKSTYEKLHTSVNYHSTDSKWFPRVVMCDFMVRHLGSNQHWMSIQCNLPINLFNEIIFLIIWVWLVFLTCFTCLSLLLYLMFICSDISRKFVSKYLQMRFDGIEKQIEYKFIENYLKSDGILILRIIAFNTNDIVMSDLVSSIYKIYLNSIKKKDQNNDHHYNQLEYNGLYARIDSTAI